jgi:hypothetical protein
MNKIQEIVCPKCGKDSGHTKEQYADLSFGIAYNVLCKDKDCLAVVIPAIDIFD